mmetsp:Transcript_8917/g.26504  ORF Transcript_8917/g.26504 Transcript_8917/m.26504 type:complete len:432 (+) Transcript_8917:3-1298(+)
MNTVLRNNDGAYAKNSNASLQDLPHPIPQPPRERKTLLLLSQWFLPRPRVEVETALQTLQPIRRMVALVDGRKGVRTHLDLDAVPPPQLGPVLPVKGNRRGRPGIVRDKTPQHHVVGKDHRPKAEHVRANGRHQDAGHRRVDHGTPRGHAVGGRTGRRRKDHSVGLDGRQVHVVAKAFQGGQVRAASPVDHHLVQNVVPGADDSLSVDDPAIQPHPYRHADVVVVAKGESRGCVAHQGLVRVGRHVGWKNLQGAPFFAVLHEGRKGRVRYGIVRVTVHKHVSRLTCSGLCGHAQSNLDRIRHLVLRKCRQEAKASPTDRQEGWNGSLKDAAGIQQETVTPQRTNQVGKRFVIHVTDPLFFVVVDVPDLPVFFVGIVRLFKEVYSFVVDPVVVFQFRSEFGSHQHIDPHLGQLGNLSSRNLVQILVISFHEE